MWKEFWKVFSLRWMPAMLSGLIAVAVSGLIINCVGNHYWKEQESIKTQELYLKQKIKIQSLVVKFLTLYINNLDEQVVAKKAKDLKRLNSLKGKQYKIEGNIALYFTLAKVLFSDNISKNIDKTEIEINRMDYSKDFPQKRLTSCKDKEQNSECKLYEGFGDLIKSMTFELKTELKPLK